MTDHSPAALCRPANTPSAPIRLHRFALSGHCHRVELLLSLLGLPVEAVDVDLAGGQHKSPAYLALNRFGQVPVIEDGEVTLADSCAILVYLASRYGAAHWLPRDPAGAAQVQRWLAVAAGPLAFGPGAARLITVFGADYRADEVIRRAHTLLQVMEHELGTRPWLAAPHVTIADIACYGYVARAPEGHVALADYPQVRTWLQRIEALPGFIDMPHSAVGRPTGGE